MPEYFGGIEAGGTKFICAIASGPDQIFAEARFPTTSSQETLSKVLDFFLTHTADFPLSAMGIASFGPLDLNRSSKTYGYVTSTPKPGWAQTDFCGPIRENLNLPVGFDTDVNGAALAEGRWGSAGGLDTFIYLTIGTGIGGGVVANRKVVHGLMHPEIGHIRIPHDTQADPFPGICPFHGDCFEGLANGPAIGRRWGKPADLLPADHQAWDLEAHYLASALTNLICTLSPQRIILGGGVMEQSHLFPRIRKKVQKMINEYIQLPEIQTDIDGYIVPPKLGNRAGILGAIALAEDALRDSLEK
jgi:fructokinase